MLVQQVMIRDVRVIPPDAPVDEAARTMADLDVGALPVSADGRTLDGIVTDRDILIRAVASGRDPGATAISEIMSSRLFTCAAEEPVEDVIRAMEQHQVRRMPVLDADGRMIGLVTLGDLTRSRAQPVAAAAPRPR